MNKLKELRIASKLTQKQLAELAGVNYQMLQRYEQGTRDLKKASFETCLKLAQALGVNIMDLFV